MTAMVVQVKTKAIEGVIRTRSPSSFSALTDTHAHAVRYATWRVVRRYAVQPYTQAYNELYLDTMAMTACDGCVTGRHVPRRVETGREFLEKMMIVLRKKVFPFA